MPENTRLAGHELLYEGAPHEFRGAPRRLLRIGSFYGGTGGTGRGKCSCGAYSDALTSGTKRKQWHREHKTAIREGRDG